MFKIQTLNSIATVGLNHFPSDLYTISAEMIDPDAILVRSQAIHNMSFSSSLKVVGRAGVGVNNIPITNLSKRGIPVLNTVGANANAVRELVIAGMLLASRNICQAWNYVQNLQCSATEIDSQIESYKKQFVGSELMGKILGVIGLGSIGVKVANSAVGLGMHVVGYDPSITVSRAWELSAGVEHAKNMEHVLSKADFISFHVPLTDATKNMVQDHHFKMMKPTAVLLNFSREGIINVDALHSALAEKCIHSYVTDFPSLTLKNHPCVISLPHLGASTVEAEDNCAVMVVKQIRDFLEYGNISNSINFPNIEMPINHGNTRLSIVNSNIPNIVAQISSKLGNEGLNITSLSNGSREEIAYTLIDVNSTVNNNIITEITGIKGVIKVRVIGGHL